MDREQAQKRIDELKGFYSHLVSFVAVNAFLIVIDITTYDESGDIWVIYPILGWGIGLAIHTFMVLFAGHDWEEQKMQELTGWSMTQLELERLSDRTENLIAILSDVNWEKIDPALVASKENLLNARDTIVELRDHGATGTGAASKEDVFQEIERLEEFVTSSKFEFYDQAQRREK
jgi:hypothetical protein